MEEGAFLVTQTMQKLQTEKNAKNYKKMWAIEKQKLSKPSKIKVTFSLDKELVQRFKNVADKESRNYSKVVNMYLSRYVNSR